MLDARRLERPRPGPIEAALRGGRAALRRLWEIDLVRLVVLTIYYLAIIIALVVIYGGTHYTPPPFIYQGF